MGSIFSYFRPNIRRIYEEDEAISGQGKEATVEFTLLGLTKENIQALFEIFCDIDKDENDFVDRDEFYYWLRVTRNDFTDRVFTILDNSHTGEINFKEFVSVVYAYCSYDVKSLTKFAFTLLDVEENNVLEKSDMRQLVYMMYGDASEEAKDEQLSKIMELIDVNGDDTISFEEFQEFSKRFPLMMLPAFKLQQVLREKVLGIDFWNNEMNKKLGVDGRMRMENIYEIIALIEDPLFKKKAMEYNEIDKTKRSIENRNKKSERVKAKRDEEAKALENNYNNFNVNKNAAEQKNNKNNNKKNSVINNKNNTNNMNNNINNNKEEKKKKDIKRASIVAPLTIIDLENNEADDIVRPFDNDVEGILSANEMEMIRKRERNSDKEKELAPKSPTTKEIVKEEEDNTTKASAKERRKTLQQNFLNQKQSLSPSSTSPSPSPLSKNDKKKSVAVIEEISRGGKRVSVVSPLDISDKKNLTKEKLEARKRLGKV